MQRRNSSDNRWITDVAGDPAISNAHRWFTRERNWINEQHLSLCRIPAPTFFEERRAKWLCRQIELLGWNAELDRVGNVRATFGGKSGGRSFIISAHLDTVFAPAKAEDVFLNADGKLLGPGVSDNGSGLAALLALARILHEEPHFHDLASSIMLIANVGEEGEGNLNGMRYLCSQLPELSSVRAFLVLDGPSMGHITTQALASRRFEISFTGSGGHSWNDYGTPNPIHAVADVIKSFVQSAPTLITGERKSRCSYNFGVIEGGASINSIPSAARAKLDLRSEEPELLEDLTQLLTAVVERALEQENRNARSIRLIAKIRELGSRPGGKLSDESVLLQTVQAVDAFLQVRSKIDCASTDANIPLSLGLPAVSVGAGGTGGGAHTDQEWYHPEGREKGLQRILLILAAMAARMGARRDPDPASL